MSASVTNDGASGDDQDTTGTNTSRQKGRSGVIKNKLKRQLLYRKERLRKAKGRRERKVDRKRKAEELGEEVIICVQERCDQTRLILRQSYVHKLRTPIPIYI